MLIIVFFSLVKMCKTDTYYNTANIIFLFFICAHGLDVLITNNNKTDIVLILTKLFHQKSIRSYVENSV